MTSILAMAWFPIIAMLAVVVLTVWALHHGSRRRHRTMVVERPVVVREGDDDRLG